MNRTGLPCRIRLWIWAPAVLATALAASGAGAEALRPLARPAALAAAILVPPAVGGPMAEASAIAPVLPPAANIEPMVAALTDSAPEGPILGPETNLPLPRFVSLKSREGNARRGPSLSHRVDWVFVREDMPLQITAEYGHWRRVVDRDGLGGWVHYAMLSGARTVIVDHDLQPLYARPDAAAPQSVLLQSGVIARLGDCDPDWCRINAGGYRGWAPKSALWGVAADEIRD